MPILTSELIEKTRNANKKFTDSMQALVEKNIKDELEGFDQVLSKSLATLEKFDKLDLKKSLIEVISRTKSMIKAKIDFVTRTGSDFPEKEEIKGLLIEIISCYLEFKEMVSPIPKPKEISRWNDSRLYLEQKAVCENLQIKQLLEQLLITIKNDAQKYLWSVPNRCFISYAWFDEKNCPHEKWIQPFLEKLKMHLNKAGVNALLDIINCQGGDNIYKYMEQVKQSECAIIVGTESLYKKYQAGVSAVCHELVLINQNRAEQKKALPILLSGTFRNALPEYLMMYTNVIDWRESSYIKNLMKLLATIYGVSLDNSYYQELWKKFDQPPYQLLMTGFPEKAVEQLLEKEKQSSSQRVDKEVQEVFDLMAPESSDSMAASTSSSQFSVKLLEASPTLTIQYSTSKAAPSLVILKEIDEGICKVKEKNRKIT